MRFFAIRHVPTGGFLPQGKGRGYTHDAPSLTRPPRLFEQVSAAERALTWWLKGQVEWDFHITEAPHRRAEDMEIVQIELEVVNAD